MANLLAALKRRPKLWAGVALVAVAELVMALSRPSSGEAVEILQSYTVQPADFVVEQAFSGRITPGEQVEVLGTTEASILEIGFRFGDRVEAGQILFKLSGDDVWRKSTEAQIAYLQARDTSLKMNAWLQGPEVRRARRDVENSRLQHEEVRRRHDEGERLFARGLISRSEMEGLQSSLRQARQSVEQSEEELGRTEARGQGTERVVSNLQHSLAGARLNEARDGNGAVIRAPISGVIVRPQTGATAHDGGGAKVGGKIGQGQSLALIAALDGLDVSFKVDEADLAMLKIGTPAVVTGPGFSGRQLKGRLHSVAGEAETGSTAESTRFEARVRLEGLSPEEAHALRIGMTAQISLKLYEAANTISVPVAALGRAPMHVRVRKPDGQIEIRPVKVGQTSADRVEILSGLNAAETVVWTP